jgi:hypothetical protein
LDTLYSGTYVYTTASFRHMYIYRASKRNFARWNKTALGSRGQTETFLKIEDLSWKYKRKQNIENIKIKRHWLQLEIHGPCLAPWARTDVPAEPLSHRPCIYFFLFYRWTKKQRLLVQYNWTATWNLSVYWENIATRHMISLSVYWEIIATRHMKSLSVYWEINAKTYDIIICLLGD